MRCNLIKECHLNGHANFSPYPPCGFAIRGVVGRRFISAPCVGLCQLRLHPQF